MYLKISISCLRKGIFKTSDGSFTKAETFTVTGNCSQLLISLWLELLYSQHTVSSDVKCLQSFLSNAVRPSPHRSTSSYQGCVFWTLHNHCCDFSKPEQEPTWVFLIINMWCYNFGLSCTFGPQDSLRRMPFCWLVALFSCHCKLSYFYVTKNSMSALFEGLTEPTNAFELYHYRHLLAKNS